jgi:hypothetical protein
MYGENQEQYGEGVGEGEGDRRTGSCDPLQHQITTNYFIDQFLIFGSRNPSFVECFAHTTVPYSGRRSRLR